MKPSPAVTTKTSNPLVPAYKLAVIPKSRQECVECLKQALQTLSESALFAGQLVVHILEIDRAEGNYDTFENLIREVPGLTANYLSTLEKIGLGKIHPLLLAGNRPRVDYLVIGKHLKMKYQEALCEGRTLPIAVPAPSGNGFLSKEKKYGEIRLDELNRAICSNGEWATVERQWELYLQEQKAKKENKTRRWKVVADKVKILDARFPFSYDELMTMAKLVEPKAQEIESSLKKRQITK